MPQRRWPLLDFTQHELGSNKTRELLEIKTGLNQNKFTEMLLWFNLSINYIRPGHIAFHIKRTSIHWIHSHEIGPWTIPPAGGRQGRYDRAYDQHLGDTLVGRNMQSWSRKKGAQCLFMRSGEFGWQNIKQNVCFSAKFDNVPLGFPGAPGLGWSARRMTELQKSSYLKVSVNRTLQTAKPLQTTAKQDPHCSMACPKWP